MKAILHTPPKPSDPIKQKTGEGCSEATCSAVSTPAEELAHLKEVARNNGYDSITDAIVKAKRYMDEIKRLRRVLHDIAGSRPDEHMDIEKTPELVKWICETCRNASVGAYPPNDKLTDGGRKTHE